MGQRMHLPNDIKVYGDLNYRGGLPKGNFGAGHLF